MINKIKLEKIFPFIEVVMNDIGLFAFLNQSDGGTPPQPLYPLVEEFVTGDNFETLDVDYFVNHSADKYISPFLEKVLIASLQQMGYTIEEFIDEFDSTDYPTLINTILATYNVGNVIYERFAYKWKKLYDALTTTYNPLHNYDMEEKRTPNITRTETFNNVQDQRTPNVTTTGNANATTGVYGFNGDSAKNSATNDGTSSESVTGTDTNVKTGNITNAETGTDTLTRKGNIGVTSSQQLLESEFEVRKHDFYEMIYRDIDSILCLKIY